MAAHSSRATQVDNLAPIGPQQRTFGGVSYVLMWWSSLIVMQAFVLGQGFLPPNGAMNLIQAAVVLVVAMLLFVVMFSLNGQAGMKYGIPYSVQTRTGFGIKGSKIVEFLRATPAIIWYGIGTWIAALSFNGIVDNLVGFSSAYSTAAYFVLFQILQTILAWRGIRVMKWFNAGGSIVIAAIMAFMLYHILSNYSVEIRASWTGTGTWGTPFWIALTGAIGVLATVMLNISDMTRQLTPSQSRLWMGHLLGIAPPWFFMLFLGIVAGASLGIWDPVEAMMQLSPNNIAMIALLAFILVAQFTTNLTINILPPALIFMDSLKLSWHQAVVLTGVLGLLSCPWLLLGNAETFFAFILYYSALLGPLLGVMLADYFVIHRQTLDVAALYNQSPGSPYWYSSGFNINGLVAVFVPGIVCMIFFLPVSWLVGLPSGFALYLLLCKINPGPAQSAKIATPSKATG